MKYTEASTQVVLFNNHDVVTMSNESDVRDFLNSINGLNLNSIDIQGLADFVGSYQELGRLLEKYKTGIEQDTNVLNNTNKLKRFLHDQGEPGYSPEFESSIFDNEVDDSETDW